MSGITTGETFQAGLRRIAGASSTAELTRHGRVRSYRRGGRRRHRRAARGGPSGRPQPPRRRARSNFKHASHGPDGDATSRSREWDFGDEESGAGNHLSHAYAQDGDYVVTLRVCDHYACAQAARSVHVGVSPPEAGTVVIREATTPPDAVSRFAYTSSLPGGAAFDLADGEQRSAQADPGEYVVDVGVMPGYELTAIACDDAGSATPSSGSVATSRATVRLDPVRP